MSYISTPDRRQSKTLLILDECGGSNTAINSVFNCYLPPFGQNFPREHSAKQLTFIKLLFVIKIFPSPIFGWPFYTGFTVCDVINKT